MYIRTPCPTFTPTPTPGTPTETPTTCKNMQFKKNVVHQICKSSFIHIMYITGRAG